MTLCRSCRSENIEPIETTSGPSDIAMCRSCGGLSVTPHEQGNTLEDYGGSGMSLEALNKLPNGAADSLLMRKLDEVKSRLSVLGYQKTALESLMRERLLARHGKRAEDSDYVLKLEPSTDWSFNLERLADLQRYVEADDFDRACVPVPAQPATIRPNKARLNDLAKRGGEIAEIVDTACTPIDTTYTVKLERKRK
jgi:hypothetical protein